MSSRFDCPAYKLLASDLRDCQPTEDGDWLLAGGGSAGRSLRLVWLQGRLSDVSEDRDSATLVDGSGSALLTRCAAAPGDPGWMAEGQYCMVVGEVRCGDPPELSVIKLAPLSDVHRQLWELEVRHVRRHLESTAAG